MLRASALGFAIVLAATASPAALADDAVTNPDVVPAPAVPGNGVLLYPGGEYGRIVHPLLQPGEPYPGTSVAPPSAPKKRIARHVKPARPSAVASLDQTPAETSAPDSQTIAVPGETAAPIAPPAAAPAPPAPKPRHKLRAVHIASAPPAPPPQQPEQSSDIGLGSVPFSLQGAPEAAPPPAPTRSLSSPPVPPRAAKASPPPTRTASYQPAPAPAPMQGLAKQTQIIFAPGAPDPSSDSVDAIKGLAGPLNTALVAGASRIQIVAYGGARGDKSSDARRLSLMRARIIRQLLIDGGVPAARIDVHAMGGATDGAAADRVDIFTKA